MNNKNNGNKKGACRGKIDNSYDINAIATQPFDDQQLVLSSDPGLDTFQHHHHYHQDQENKLQDLYKTEICRNWEEQGTCRYGPKCQYAHGNHELRYVQRHPRYKSIHCRSFESTGTCSYGKRCTFLHEQKSPPGKPLSRGCQQQQFTLPLEKDTPTVTTNTPSAGRSSLSVACKSTSSSTRLTPLKGTSTATTSAAVAAPNITIPRSSPLLEDSTTSTTSNPTSSSSSSSSLLLSSASTHISTQTLTLLPYYHQYPQHGSYQLDPSLYCDHYQFQYHRHQRQKLQQKHQSHHHHHHQQQQQQPQHCKLGPAYLYNQTTKSGSCLTKDLFTDTGGFSCAFGLSPPLLSPSNSNIHSSSSYFSSQFSPSSSTVTTSSASSSSSTTNAIDSKHHLFQ